MDFYNHKYENLKGSIPPKFISGGSNDSPLRVDHPVSASDQHIIDKINQSKIFMKEKYKYIMAKYDMERDQRLQIAEQQYNRSK